MCFWCEEKYEPGHNCKGKKPRFYHIEVGYTVEEEEKDYEPVLEDQEATYAQISLQALDGYCSLHTMRMMGLCGKTFTRLA